MPVTGPIGVTSPAHTAAAAPPRVPTLDEVLAAAEARVGTGANAAAYQAALVAHLASAAALTCVRLWLLGADRPRCLASSLAPPKPHGGAAEPATPPAELAGLEPGRTALLRTEGGSRLLASAAVSEPLSVGLDVSADAELPGEMRTLLAELVEVMADLQRRRTLRRLLAEESRAGDAVTLISRLHGTLDAELVCNRFASEATGLLGADTLCVLRRRGHRWRLVAATGVADPDGRSDAARAVVGRVKAAAKGAGDPDVRPATADGTWTSARAAVVFERQPDVSTNEPLERSCCRELGASLENCRVASRGMFSRLSGGAASFVRPLPVLATAALLGLATWLWMGTLPLKITAAGQAVPVTSRVIFTPEDGTIRDVLVNEGDAVAAGEVLVRLTNEDFALRQEELAGRLAEAEARLAALATMRGVRDPAEVARISSERAELETRVDSTGRLLAVLSGRAASLEIRSPIKGTVRREGDLKSLRGRPVSRAQRLLRVVDEGGAWEVRLDLPADEVRHVLTEAGVEGGGPTLEYVLETQSDVVRRATLETIDRDARLGPNGEPVFEARFPLPPQTAKGLPRGAGVVAAIDCGPRRVGAVVLRRAIEFIQRRLWLW